MILNNRYKYRRKESDFFIDLFGFAETFCMEVNFLYEFLINGALFCSKMCILEYLCTSTFCS